MTVVAWVFLAGFVVMSIASAGLLFGTVRMAASLTDARELLRTVQGEETGHLREMIMDYLRKTEHYG